MRETHLQHFCGIVDPFLGLLAHWSGLLLWCATAELRSDPESKIEGRRSTYWKAQVEMGCSNQKGPVLGTKFGHGEEKECADSLQG